MTLPTSIKGLTFALAVIVASLFPFAPTHAQSNGSCNGRVNTANFSGNGLSSVRVGGDMLATEYVDFSILSGTFEGGQGTLQITLVDGGSTFCTGHACDGMRFTAQSDGVYQFDILGRTSDGGSGSVRAACTAASTGDDDDDGDGGDNGDGGGNDGDDTGHQFELIPDEIAEMANQILNQVEAAMGRSNLIDLVRSNLAIGTTRKTGFAPSLTSGMTRISGLGSGQEDTFNGDNALSFFGTLNQNQTAIGFETKLGANGGTGLGRRDGNSTALVGTVRYYSLDGTLEGDAWQGQIGYRHPLGDSGSVLLFGSFRNADVDANTLGFALEEDSYGAGLMAATDLSSNTSVATVVLYENGDVDITAGGASGNTDVTRWSGAALIRSEFDLGGSTLAPFLTGGFSHVNLDSYRDSLATLIPGRSDTSGYGEAGVMLASDPVESGAGWYVDASIDYSGETLDNAPTLSGGRLNDGHFGGNGEAGLRLPFGAGGGITLSAGTRGIGRDSRAYYGGAKLVMPLN